MKVVTIVIPCYNCYDFIDRAVRSVLAQNFKDYEIILVNNNSNDGTFNKLQQLKAAYPNIIRVFNEFKPGAPAARNKGISHATGEYIQFLDADDQLEIDKIKSQVEIATRTGADVIIGNFMLSYDINGRCKTYTKYFNKNSWEGLLNSNLGITSSNLWRKSSLLKAGCWDTLMSSSQEYDLLFRLLKIGAAFSFDDTVNTIVYKLTNSISKSTDKEKLQRIVYNRIKLRMDIKEYLYHCQLNTPKLTEIADFYIYQELMSNYDQLPLYVNEFLKNNILVVNKMQQIKINVRRLFKKYAVALT